MHAWGCPESLWCTGSKMWGQGGREPFRGRTEAQLEEGDEETQQEVSGAFLRCLRPRGHPRAAGCSVQGRLAAFCSTPVSHPGPGACLGLMDTVLPSWSWSSRLSVLLSLGSTLLLWVDCVLQNKESLFAAF